MKVNVLGTEYEIFLCSNDVDPKLDNHDGYCDTSVRKIVVDAMNKRDKDSKADLDAYRKSVIRHELLHAFLYESGLDAEIYWAKSEEMVDWLAIQFPKLMRAMREAGALDA